MCKTKPSLLIVVYSYASLDPRVRRQIHFLHEHFAITLIAFDTLQEYNLEFYPVTRKKRSKFHKIIEAISLLFNKPGRYLKSFQFHSFSKLQSCKFDLVLVNDALPLPLSFELAGTAPVVFDAHEYYPRESEESLIWRILFKRLYTSICNEYIQRCAGVTTVSDGIAHEYNRVFGCAPQVIRNVPSFINLNESITQPDCIRLIHHGQARADRKIERMIAMADYLEPRFTLDLMLVGEGSYKDRLRKMAAQRTNINWREPVSIDNICKVINDYDLGIYIMPPTNFNTLNALPNKIFEYIQARLGVVIGPSPEMQRLVNQNNIGVVASDFTPQAMAKAINNLSLQDIVNFKHNAQNKATILCAEKEMLLMLNLLKKTIGK